MKETEYLYNLIFTNVIFWLSVENSSSVSSQFNTKYDLLPINQQFFSSICICVGYVEMIIMKIVF